MAPVLMETYYTVVIARDVAVLDDHAYVADSPAPVLNAC